MLTESFLGSGNIVLAAEQEEIEITNGADSDNLEGVVGENADSSEGEEYNTENLDILFELEENRDRTSKHFRLSDGTIMAADYGMDIHYEEDGQWRDIDNRFVYEAPTEEDSMEGFATAEGNVEFKFAPDTGDGEVVRATTGDYSVGFEFLADAVDIPNEADVSMMHPEDTVDAEGVNTDETEDMQPADAESTAAQPPSERENQIEAAMENGTGETEENAPIPITFIKGDILNESEAAQVLDPVEMQTEPVSSYAANAVSMAEAENEDAEAAEVVWADAGVEHNDGEERALMEQASLEHAVTSVGYGNVKPGVSLQYIASGSSLKEYILLSKRQDSYVYRFEMNLGNLEAQMQEDGSILLYDPADGKAVYEIPASYMTDAAGAFSDEVEMELAEAGNGRYILTLTADAAWIDAEERVFPVQIDPTLNQLFSNESDIKGFYVIEEQEKKTTENYGRMLVGYDGSGYGNMTTYVQLKNLEALPQDSVICAAYFNMAVVYWDECECPKLHIQAKRLAEKSDWNKEYCYEECPAVSAEVIDRQTFTSADLGTYAVWNITELVKEHYEAGNQAWSVLDFALESTGGMRDGYYVNAGLNLTWISGAKPVLQTFYRDTKGLEDYYTYQSQSIGNAGTGYISDYSLQLTVAKNISSYSSTVMSCDIGLVYNSPSCSSYFTNSDSIHTKDFSNMNTGLGWKLNLQETVVPVEVEDLEDTTEYLVYNDSDGTEHYFHYNKETAIYEDEDGLGLTITGNNAKYTMTDEKDNEKIFENGYLKTMKDANGNQINIVYNASNQISSVTLDTVSGAPVTIYNFIYDTGSKCLTEIHDYGGRKYLLAYEKNSDNKWNLRKISRRTGDDSTTETVEAEYLYDANSRLTRAYDAESKNGIEYTYYKSPTGYHVYECRDFAAGNIGTSEPVYGTEIRAWPIETRQTRYRYWGMDRKMGTEDDIVTTYLFNSAGQTINASSEDGNEDRVLGVTAAAYEENSGTNKTNNRMNQSISSGQSGINLLINGGFEKSGSSDTIAESWSSYTSSGAAARKSDGVTTGLAYSGKCYYNLFGSSISAISSIYQDITVVQGETYTFSAYVNTKDLVGTNKGVYLYARQIDNQNILAESVIIDYVTDASLDGGWQRLMATFTEML